MAGDRDGNRVIDGVRRGSSSPTAPTPRHRPRTSRVPTNATITASSTCSANLPVRDAGARIPRDCYSDWCGGPGGTHQPMCPVAHRSQSLARSLARRSTFRASRLAQTMGRGAALAASGNANVAAERTVDHRHPQRHIPDAIGIELQCRKPSTSDGQAMLQPTATGTACFHVSSQGELDVMRKPESSGSAPRRWRSAAC